MGSEGEMGERRVTGNYQLNPIALYTDLTMAKLCRVIDQKSPQRA